VIARSASRLFLLAALAASTAFAADPALLQRFGKAKQKFKQSQFAQSLADFDELDKLSQEPGYEADRKQLDPVLQFYRAANLAALGKKDDARAMFITYLSIVPRATLDAKQFPPAVNETFQAARRDVGLGIDNRLATEFADFHPATATLPVDEHWADTPVRYLLSHDENRQWGSLKSDEERRAFVEVFWKKLDPTGGDEDNPLRREFERRVLYAERKFGSERHPGSRSDRAVVFALFGPPSYVGLARLRAGDDKVTSMRGGTNNADIADYYPSVYEPRGKGPMSGRFTGMGKINGKAASDGISTDLERGTREAWYYRKGRLASAMRYADLHVDFFTKEGYGTGILQRDPEILQALGQAAELMLKAKALR
jgi:GWxTD domain-containing protein